MTPTRLFYAGLACYRLTRLVYKDHGPHNSIDKLKLWLINKDIDQATGKNRLDLVSLFDCPYCIGMWIALLLTPFVLIKHTFTDIVLTLFAVAGLQSLIEGGLNGPQ